MENYRYAVVNDRGDVVGHDMREFAAEELCATMRIQEPNEGWEVIGGPDDTENE